MNARSHSSDPWSLSAEQKPGASPPGSLLSCKLMPPRRAQRQAGGEEGGEGDGGGGSGEGRGEGEGEGGGGAVVLAAAAELAWTVVRDCAFGVISSLLLPSAST